MKTTARDTTARFWFAVAVACALQTTFAQRLLTDEEVGIVSPPHRDSTNSATPAIESTAQAMQQAKTDEFGGVAVDPVPGSAAPASQPAHPTATAGAEQDWVPTVILATLVGGVVLLVLWQLLLYFSRSSRGRSPPGSLPHVIEAVSPSHTVHLHPSRLKDSSPAVLGEQLHVGIDAAPLCLPAASLPVYFILHNNEPEGPYTIEDLRSLWNSGAVTGETFYCEEGDEAWLHLEAVADRLQSSPVGRTSVAETHTNLSPLITPPPLPSAAGQQKPDSQRWTCRLNGVPPAASAPLPLTESREIVSPAGQRTTADCYTTSNCRFCGGSIEFPEHGLGEWVDCPHCGRQLQLRNMGTTERFLVGVRVWCRERSFNWKWASSRSERKDETCRYRLKNSRARAIRRSPRSVCI